MKLFARLRRMWFPRHPDVALLGLRASARRAERVLSDLAEIDPIAALCARAVIRGDGIIINCDFYVPAGFTVRERRRSDGRGMICLEPAE